MGSKAIGGKTEKWERARMPQKILDAWSREKFDDHSNTLRKRVSSSEKSDCVMMLCRVSGIAVGDRAKTESLRMRPDAARPGEFHEKEGGAIEAFRPMNTGEGASQDATGWPQISEANATSQIPSFEKVDPLESHGGATFQKKTDALLCSGKTRPGETRGGIQEHASPARRRCRGGGVVYFKKWPPFFRRSPEETDRRS